jgi:hypothetical protein
MNWRARRAHPRSRTDYGKYDFLAFVERIEGANTLLQRE